MSTAADSEAVITAIRADDADLGFVESPRVPRNVRSTVVAHDQLVPVARPDDRLARRSRPVTAAEIARTALVSREAGSGAREALAAALRAVLGPDTPEPPVSLSLTTTSGGPVGGAGRGRTGRARYSTAFHARGLVYRVPMAGFALLRGARALAATVRTARRGLPFSLTRWSFTFPDGTVVTGTFGLAAATGLHLFTGAAVLFYVGLLAAGRRCSSGPYAGLGQDGC